MIRKAFQVSALDYLVKPLDEVEVRQALLRSFRYLSKKRNRIALKNQSGVEIFYHEEIEYIESEKEKCGSAAGEAAVNFMSGSMPWNRS